MTIASAGGVASGGVVILEDEAPARQALEAALGRIASVEIRGAFASIAQAAAWFRANPAPDLVLADIQLADGLSFELFDQIEVSAPVIFVTAFDEYAIEAMTAGGIDYLLKPIVDADLARALDRYRKLEAHFAERVRAVAAKLARPPRRLLARSRDGFVTLPLDQVAYIVLEQRVSEVVARDGRRLVLDRPLAELEAELTVAEFFRVNRQYLVAASAIRGFKPFIKGKLLVELEPAAPGDVIVSQENAARFKAWLAG